MSEERKEYQGRVSKDPAHNEGLDMQQRLSNLEHDTSQIYTVIYEDRERRLEDKLRRRKYDEYLDKLLEREQQTEEFWKEAKQKLVVQGAWTAIGIVCFALWFTFKEQIKGP
jgi:4-alpha-glucanotransferase